MKKNLDYYMNLDYEISVKKVKPEDGGGWFAYYKDFKGIMGDGESADEALQSAQEAFKALVTVKKIDDFIAPLHITRSAFLQKAAIKEIGA